MRLLFFLTALFFALGLHAQPNCQISDLVTTFSVADPGPCKYNIKLDFKHQGTTNQFNVKGNGVDYGNFTYTSLPVTLGPIMGQPNVPTVRELIVTDLVKDCKAETTVTLPPCPAVSACDILDATATPGDCLPGGGGFSLKIDFKVQSPGNDFFEVWTSNGVKLGIFPLTALPLTIPNFPSNGTVNGSVKICINDQPNCCETIDFKAPVCPPNCGWVVQPDTGKCTSDSTYSMMFKIFSPNPVPPTDSFLVYANGDYIGTYAWNQLPVTVPNFPWGGGAFDVIQVCAKATLGAPTCCAEAEFLAPKCLPYEPCAMSRIHLEVDSCTTDSTFKVTVNFLVANPTKVDSFSVFADGKFLGKFGLNQLPLMIPNYPWTKGTIFSTIRICTGNAPQCCRERQFVVPKCLPFGDCKVTNIQIKTGPCRADGTFKATINFQATNPGNGTFTVFGNGQVLGIFPLSAAPVMVNFPSNGAAIDVVRICINPLTPNTILCCESKEFEGPVCPTQDCAIKDLKVDVGDCIADGIYKATIKFAVQNPSSQKFSVFANGQNLGVFDLSQLPLSVNISSNGAAADVIRVCMVSINPISVPCCADIEFEGPDCPKCEIFDIKVDVGTCTSDSTYKATVNFSVTSPFNSQFVLFVNGQNLGTFNLSQLPLTLSNFPSNGTAIDVLKVCMVAQGAVTCCKTIEFEGLNCYQNCEIFDLEVAVANCTSDSTYKATVNFEVFNPLSDKFSLFVNGKNLGIFNLNQLPLTLSNFPSNGAAGDVLKVCMEAANPGQAPCCKTIDFQGPVCNNQGCEIFNLKVDVGACTSDSTYKATIKFDVQNPPSTQFTVTVNGQNLGTFNLNQLPLALNNFPSNGTAIDVVKVCMVAQGAVACCKTIEFQGPACNMQDCKIYDLTAKVGDCTSDSTYKITINFQVQNPGNNFFEVWAGGGQYLGIFPLSALPLTIANYPEGNANNFLKVCINDQPNCCKTVQFSGPNCGSGPCEITNFLVTTGVCTSDSSYKLTLDFDVINPLTNMFSVTANGQFFGFYNLNQLPLTINFPWNGGANDFIEVCVVTAPGIACCKKLEFKVPDCILNPVCEIYDLSVLVGDCTSDSTYKVKVDFQVSGNTSQEFMLWANGQSLGTFNLNQLPLTINNFPWDGGAFDVVKVCMKSSDPNAPLCCRSKEFAVPACLQQCEIKELTVTTGDCTSASTYKVKINFVVKGSSSNTFGVWANGVNIGFYTLNQLPLTIQDFPSNGGANDVIKICMMGNNTGQVLCCVTKEFPVPACIDLNCKIWDLKVIKTPCLCGKFFAVLTFNHQNGGSGGFDIVGNGQNYGNFPYNHPQPIIIGPLMGDGITMYEFAVKDHLHADCKDDVNLGKVECSTPTDELAGGSGRLALSPNPASERLTVSAQMDGISSIGQVQVEVRHADGRLMMTTSVPDGNNFQLDVSTLASGVYRLTLLADRGRLEGSFVKSE